MTKQIGRRYPFPGRDVRAEANAAGRPPNVSNRTRVAAPFVLALVLSLPAEVLGLDLEAPPLTPLAEDGIHDPDGQAINVLQQPSKALKDFPKDRRGEVNWVKALEQGLIDPRKSINDDPWEKEIMKPMDLNILFTKTAQMPYVLFPHRQHTEWLACSNCHPAIFIPEKDANPISMTRILNGEFCGRCHDKVSFSLWVCERCHSVPQPGQTKWWK
jgi:c(7)-type cytochrome triheme protein